MKSFSVSLVEDEVINETLKVVKYGEGGNLSIEECIKEACGPGGNQVTEYDLAFRDLTGSTRQENLKLGGFLDFLKNYSDLRMFADANSLKCLLMEAHFNEVFFEVAALEIKDRLSLLGKLREVPSLREKMTVVVRGWEQIPTSDQQATMENLLKTGWKVYL